jgi:hypothetical protein
MKIKELLAEYASAGGTASGSIASISGGTGGPLMPVIRRMPAGQSFFGGPVIKKKRKVKRESTQP